MNGQRDARRPIQHETYNFPDISNGSEGQIDPSLANLFHPRAAASSPLRPPPAARSSTPANTTSNVIKPALNKTGITLHIEGMKERIALLEGDNEILKSTINKIEAEARKEKNRVGQELITLRELIADLQRQINDNTNMMDVDDGGDNSNAETKLLDEETSEALEKSYAAASSNVFLALLRIVFAASMGCPNKLTGETLPEYPKEGEEWPLKTDSDEKAMRFRWDQPYSFNSNWKNLQAIIKEMRRNGQQHSPGASSALADISDEDLNARVTWKFNELSKTFKAYKKAQLAATSTAVIVATTDLDPDGLANDEAPNLTGNVTVPKGLSAGVRQSRAKGKLDVRLRKRNNLPKDHELRDKRYDAAMAPTLMSDDEDCVKDGEIVTTEFVSRPPVYRSEELKGFYAKIDKLVDPVPSRKYVKRVTGEPKDIPPPITKKLDNRARRWMVSLEWLNREENKDFDRPSRIAESGKAWGDEKDPEEIEATHKRVKEEKEDLKRKKAKTEVAGSKKTSKGKGKMKAVTNGPAGSSSRAKDPQDDLDDEDMYE